MAIYLTQQKEILEDIGSLELEVVLSRITAHLMALPLQLPLVDRIREAQIDNSLIQ